MNWYEIQVSIEKWNAYRNRWTFQSREGMIDTKGMTGEIKIISENETVISSQVRPVEIFEKQCRRFEFECGLKTKTKLRMYLSTSKENVNRDQIWNR